MSNMSKYQHDKLYPDVVSQQGGEYCVMCDREKPELINAGMTGKFVIDVADNSHDHSVRNLRQMQLLCPSCNTKKNHPRTTEPQERTATPEMILGKRYESDFRRWVAGMFMPNENVGFEYSFLVNSGAEKVGCSPETIKRYLNKMTSAEGMYEWSDRFGSVLLVLKKEFKFEN